ncbi:hypothetical protein TSACC_21831 [Terrimicrobium sacchariphilum]|uniref:Uncharacterized protein n=1 Tax=Terrimicrobium sacchariphilum TaxID=690879 RepID=A0A146G6R3_TERSA|nr:hypothetical protein [Terrimicrobium sacchariphilum]GAT33415.1 hypothetical protein TSACC_21831 [Terrimicrobium sacchariphilum]
MRRKRKYIAGSVLVYALLICMVGAVMLASWISLLGSRVRYVEEAVKPAIKRRVVLENSRALATEYLLENVLPYSYQAMPEIDFDALDGWGEFSLDASAQILTPLNSTTVQHGVSGGTSYGQVNHFSPGLGIGFQTVLSGQLSDGEGMNAWAFYAKSRSPIFAGDLLTMQRSGVVSPVGSNVFLGGVVMGAANFVAWQAGSFGLTAKTFQAATVAGLATINGPDGPLVQLDFPFIPVTSGSGYYDGTLNVVSPSGGINSLATRLVGSSPVLVDPQIAQTMGGATTDGTGGVTIDLGQISGNYSISGNMTRLTLIGVENGVTGESYPMARIVYVQTVPSAGAATSIVLSGNNTRRVYLGLKKLDGSATVSLSGANASWRLAGSIESCPLTFSLAGHSLTVTGGFRTNRGFQISGGGSVTIQREAAAWGNLESFADRNAWLEVYRQ